MTNPSSLSDQARSIFSTALAASTVEAAFSRKLSTPEIDGLRHVAFTDDSAPDPRQFIPIGHLRHLRVVSIGKAAAEMLRALLPRLPLPPACTIEGVLIARERPPDLPLTFQFFPGAHPLPNEASFAGARAALDLLRQPAPDPGSTLCLFLVSGGASAMMELPLDPGTSLADTVALYRELVHSGASITGINCVRKHFSAVKGGRLALAAAPLPCLSLLVSDVPPASLDALGSGPTLPDTSTVADCREILARHNLLNRLPASIRSFFNSPGLPETPKPGELHAPHWTLLDSTDLATTAAAEASKLGYRTVIDNTCDDWDYKDAAHYLLGRLRDLRHEHPGEKVCLLSTGEVTVHIPAPPSNGNGGTTTPHGCGGRNQHIALYLATLLEPSDSPIAILSAGSDGIDGNSDAAGAVLDDRTLGPDLFPAREALARFDATPFLASHDATIVTGPTGNNLRDLRILLTAH